MIPSYFRIEILEIRALLSTSPDVASFNPSWVTYPTSRLRTLPSSVLFRSWQMLESKFTTQDQRWPWVSASRNIRLGSSIWTDIISARYCFVYWRLLMETLLHFARRRKLFVEKGEWCCAKDNTQYRTWVAWCYTTEYLISFPICSLKMWLACEIKIMRS